MWLCLLDLPFGAQLNWDAVVRMPHICADSSGKCFLVLFLTFEHQTVMRLFAVTVAFFKGRRPL